MPAAPASRSPWPPQRRGVPGAAAKRSRRAPPSAAKESTRPLRTTTAAGKARASTASASASSGSGSAAGAATAARHRRANSARLGVSTRRPGRAARSSSDGSAQATVLRASPSSTSGRPASSAAATTARAVRTCAGARPRPGPTTSAVSRGSHARTYRSAAASSSAVAAGDPAAGTAGRHGCTIRSGEYALMAVAASAAQNTCARSAPARSAAIAAKYGAPVYCTQPPSTPTRPPSPLAAARGAAALRNAATPAISRSVKLVPLFPRTSTQRAHHSAAAVSPTRLGGTRSCATDTERSARRPR